MGFPEADSSVLIPCQGVLFDNDGILIASIESAERSWTKWARMRDVDPEAMLKVMHGYRTVDTLTKLRPDLDLESEVQFVEDLQCADKEGLKVLPGVLDLLRALPRDRWTVVTSGTERLARVRLAACGIPMPEKLVTAERVIWGKPHPEPFLAGAALLGFKPEECVVFEDSASGVEAGRAAGCTVVATTFSHSSDSLGEAHYVIEDLTSVSVEKAASGIVLRLGGLAG
jgi:sugar-phosphatase